MKSTYGESTGKVGTKSQTENENMSVIFKLELGKNEIETDEIKAIMEDPLYKAKLMHKKKRNDDKLHH